MYLLFVSSGLMLFYVIYTCIFGNYFTKKKVKTFDYKSEEYDFIIDNIKFYKNDKCIKTKEFDRTHKSNLSQVKKNVELNVDFIYDFFVVDYYYNSNNYKFLSDNSFLTFPIYAKEQIKTYVYTNKIKFAEIKKEDSDGSNDINPDITNEINKFVGPNYNFYKDIDYKFKSEYLISYLKSIGKLHISDIDSDTDSKPLFKFVFYDNFNNEYSNYDDYLTWEPNLSL